MNKPIELSDIERQRWMARLIARSKRLASLAEVPVVAVILDSRGRCIGRGSNWRERSKNPLGHAELMALRQAAWLKGDWRFNDCTLITNLEPCPMCAGALTQARMGHVIFGAYDYKRGGLGGSIDIANHSSAHHRMKVSGGVMEDEAKTELQNWFKQRRQFSRENEATQKQID